MASLDAWATVIQNVSGHTRTLCRFFSLWMCYGDVAVQSPAVVAGFGPTDEVGNIFGEVQRSSFFFFFARYHLKRCGCAAHACVRVRVMIFLCSISGYLRAIARLE